MSDLQDAIHRAIPIMREEFSGAMYAVKTSADIEGYVVDVADWRTITKAARRVANGIPTPFCTTHKRTMPSTDSWHGHIGHHSPTEGCHIVQAVIALSVTEDE